MNTNKHTIEYVAAEPGVLYACDANHLLGLERMTTVIKHRAHVVVEYLIEHADGTREWLTAENDLHMPDTSEQS